MITNRKELKEYLLADKRQLGIKNRVIPRPFTDEIWKYEIVLRKYEYWYNKQGGLIAKIICCFYKILHHRNSIKLGIGIGVNCCEKGLSIAHIGTIQINGKAVVGENLRIQEGVTIGAGKNGFPIIGNNVYLGTGCKIIGGIRIADNCAIGANAVVVKDIMQPGITVAGVPAKKVSDNNSYANVFWFNEGKPYVDITSKNDVK